MIMILNNSSHWLTVDFISLNRPGVIGYARAITLNGREKMVQPFTPSFRSFTLRSPDAGRILIMQMHPFTV